MEQSELEELLFSNNSTIDEYIGEDENDDLNISKQNITLEDLISEHNENAYEENNENDENDYNLQDNLEDYIDININEINNIEDNEIEINNIEDNNIEENNIINEENSENVEEYINMDELEIKRDMNEDIEEKQDLEREMNIYQNTIDRIKEKYEKKEEIYVLEEKGYVYLRNVYDIKVIEKLNMDINQFMTNEGIFSHLQKRQDVQTDTYFVNNTYGVLQNFQKLQFYYLPVINNRGTYNRSTDKGLIEIYNVEKLIPSVKEYFDTNLMQILLNKISGIEWKLNRINLQLHIGVSNPVGFHIDNGNDRMVKYSIYLNDIIGDEYGPPMFIEKTHKMRKGFKNSDAIKFIGNMGDVLIHYQNGMHRKLPQKMNNLNGFLTFNFIPRLERYTKMDIYE